MPLGRKSNQQQQRSSQQGQPSNAAPHRQGQDSPREPRPANAPSNMRSQAAATPKTTKVKKPVTKGTVIACSIIVSFILLLIFSVALIFVAVTRTAGEQAVYAQLLSDAENEVREASVNVAFSPAESIRQKALAPSVNLEVTRGDAKKSDDAEKKDSNQSSGNVASNGSNNDGSNSSGDNQQQNDQQDNQQAQVEQNADDSSTTTFGSGVLVSQQGDLFYIITNNHVIKNATKIIATIGDEEYEAEVTGTDQSTDLAIISIKAKNLTVAEIGQSANVKTGDFTMSIGNPYGLNDSMTTGIISALGRNMIYVDGANSIMYANMMQTDTPVNPGNSGGGLYDATGRLIGINTLITGDAGHPDAIGYAIPIDFAIPIAKNLIAGNPAAHSSFGLALSNVPEDQIKKYGLTSDAGAYVNSITPSGPAEIAGIVPNDIIVQYDGKDVKNAQDMLYKIRASVINETKDIVILREGKEMKLSIKVGSDV